MKLRGLLLLFLVVMPLTSEAKYLRVNGVDGEIIKIYKPKEIPEAIIETSFGSASVFFGIIFPDVVRRESQPPFRSQVFECNARWFSRALFVGGFVCLVDALRRVISNKVGVELSKNGLRIIDENDDEQIVRWDNIARIECKPGFPSYSICIATRSGVPVKISGKTLSVSESVLIYLIGEFYQGDIQI